MTNCNTLEEPYISIYDRPKKPRGRNKKYNTPEELAQAKRDTAQRFRDKYPEYVALQKKIWAANKLEK